MNSIMAVFFALSLTGAASALVTRDAGCCFHLKAFGGPGGSVGQLSDGQNRIGQANLTASQYCINNGGLTDSNGRGCILTPPTTQWQCDAGAAPTAGFSVTCNGTLAYNESTTFYSCSTGSNGGYNIYAKPLADEPGCVPIWLRTDNQACNSGCPASSSSVSATPSATPSTTAVYVAPTPQSTCPMELSGNWEFPHLIIPINSQNPNEAYGNSLNGSASGSWSSIFNFDIPASDAGKTCTLEFLFPTQSTLETSAYTFSGNGSMQFTMLNGAATKDTTYANAPTTATNYGNFMLAPGNAYKVADFACPAGQAIGIWMNAIGDTALNYFQDYNPCPIGMYVTVA